LVNLNRKKNPMTNNTNDNVPVEQQSLTWGTCLGSMHYYNPSDLQKAVNRYHDNVTDEPEDKEAHFEAIPSQLQEIVPNIKKVISWIRIDSPKSAEVLRQLLVAAGTSEDSLTDTNKRLYLLCECGDGSFNLISQYDGIRLTVINVQLDYKRYTAESLIAAWETIQGSQNRRLKADARSKLVMNALQLNWGLLKRQKLSLLQLLKIHEKSASTQVRNRMKDVRGLLDFVDSVQDAIVDSGALSEEVVFNHEKADMPEFPEIRSLFIELEEKAGELWGGLLRTTLYHSRHGQEDDTYAEWFERAVRQLVKRKDGSAQKASIQLVKTGLVNSIESDDEYAAVLELTTAGLYQMEKYFEHNNRR